MTKKKTGLGRGFDALIPSDFMDEAFDVTATEDNRVSDLRYVALSAVTPDPDQPRREFDQTAIEELAASITQHGILQPLVVVAKSGGYEIIAGERRYRAAKLAGLEKLPVIIRTVGAQHKLELALIENIQRRDLSVLETAASYKKLRDQFNLTLDEIGQRVGGKSVSSVSNTIRLLQLPEQIQQLLRDGTLKEGQVRPLIGASEEIIAALLPQIKDGTMTARQIEQTIKQLKNDTTPATALSKKPVQKSTHVHEVLTQRLGVPVDVSQKRNGSGKFVISFKDNQQYQELLDRLQG